jgi:hypothetical protein
MYKKLVVFVSVLTIIVGAALLGQPNKHRALASETPKSKLSPTPGATICPVVGGGALTTEEPPYAATDSDGGVVSYKHCKTCNTGVYSVHANNQIFCTFCGKPE